MEQGPFDNAIIDQLLRKFTCYVIGSCIAFFIGFAYSETRYNFDTLRCKIKTLFVVPPCQFN